MTPTDLARVLRAAADEAERLEAEQRAERRDWIDQSTSLLGRRRHCALARRLIAEGSGDTVLLGRRYLISHSRLEQELRTPHLKRESKRDLAAELGLILVGGTRGGGA